jgi:hypothetical protein
MATLQPAWGEVFEVPPATTGEDLLRQVWNVHGTTMLAETQTLTSLLLPGFSAAMRFLLDG